MAPSTSSQPMYGKDEKVLCFHHELLYEAKVLEPKLKDASDKKDGYMYRVHYKGWKNTWDDWVPQERIRKLTDENKELANNLKKDMEAQKRAAAGKPPLMSTTKKRPYGSDLTASSLRGSEDRSSAAPPPPPRGVKRGREIEGIDKEEEFMRRPAVHLFMPEALKSILVDDWERVTKEQKLAIIPAAVTITMFLDKYYEAEQVNHSDGSADSDLLEETIAGIKEYFNKSLGRMLLYRFERQQYLDIHKKIESGHGEHAGKTLCDMYGCEHLLRLFVSMPDLIAHTNMDMQAVGRLREELSKMTTWLSKRIETYLSASYEHAGQAYLDGAKTGV